MYKRQDDEDEDDDTDADDEEDDAELTTPAEKHAHMHRERHISAKGEKHMDIDVGIDVDNVTQTTAMPSQDYVNPIIVSSLHMKPKHEEKHHVKLPNSEGVIIPSDSPRLMLVAQRLVTHI